MKTRHVAVVSVVSCIGLICALAAVAQQTNQNQSDRVNPSGSVRSSVDAGTAGAERNLGRLDEKTSGSTIRASQLLGMDIKNSNGDEIGEIQDLVVDASGRIRYVAVEYGGILGLGSKFFAVPFEAFHVRQDPDDPDDRNDFVLTLDVTKDQLDGAQGFDDERWPDFADTKFTQELDRRYRIDRTRTQPRR